MILELKINGDFPFNESNYVLCYVNKLFGPISSIYRSSIGPIIQEGQYVKAAIFDNIESGRYTITAILLNRELQPIARYEDTEEIDDDFTKIITINVENRIPTPQKGQVFVGLSLSRKVEYLIRFPYPFLSDNVKVLVTLTSEDSGFVYSTLVKQVGRHHCKVDIYRVDGPSDNSGWNDSNLKLNWIAWE